MGSTEKKEFQNKNKHKLIKFCAQLHSISVKREPRMMTSGMNTHLVHPRSDECSSKLNVFPPKRPGTVVKKCTSILCYSREMFFCLDDLVIDKVRSETEKLAEVS